MFQSLAHNIIQLGLVKAISVLSKFAHVVYLQQTNRKVALQLQGLSFSTYLIREVAGLQLLQLENIQFVTH